MPLLVWGPGRIKSRGTIPSLANLVDLPRTFLSLAGLNPPQEWQGVDLTPLLRGEADAVQDAVLIEMRATQRTLNQHTLITERYKLVVYRHTEEGELYDLQADPDQYHNLWDDGAFRSLRGDLLLRLARLHMEREPVGPPRVSFA